MRIVLGKLCDLMPLVIWRCLLILSTAASGNANSIELTETSPPINPIHNLAVLEDPNDHLTLRDIEQLPDRAFKTPEIISGSALNFGFTKSTYWIKLTVSRKQDLPDEWIIRIPYLGLDQIDFFALDKPPVKTGSVRDIKSRALYNRFYVFPASFDTTPQDFYFRVKSNNSLTVPLEIIERQTFIESTQKELIIQFLYFGGMLALIIYNIQIYFALHDKTYLFYGVFGLMMGLGIFAGNGFGRILFWPEQPLWDQISMSVLLSIGASFSILFARSFLKTSRLTPIIDLSLKLLIACYLTVGIGLITTLWGFSNTYVWFQMLMALTAPYFILISAAAIRVLILGHESAKYYLASWGFLCCGVILATLRTYDWVPTNVVTTYAIQIGLGSEMLFLSYALAYRIRFERAKREQAQSEAFKSHQLMIETLTKSEETLEYQVAERTTQLQCSLESEKKLHEQYVRFGAMISHEFRNPLNNIQSQADLLVREHRLGIDQFDKRMKIIAAASRQLGFLFDRWMQTDRLKNTLALRNVQPIDINIWLKDLIDRYQQSTPNHEFVFNECEMDPFLMADEALLQIAVINLLDNACKYSANNSPIFICTKIVNNLIGIEVCDHGEGIDPSLHHTIFQEYFRVNPTHTKRGAGLGLAFVKRIADLHQGMIEVSSVLGSGATFTLWLPKQQVTN